MRNQYVHLILLISITLTFLIPLIQLSIGFHFVVKDGQNASEQCSIAPDLPLLLSIGGVFTLLFLGIAYSLLRMIANTNQHSDMSGRIPKILVGRFQFTRKRKRMTVYFRFNCIYLWYDNISLLSSHTNSYLRCLFKSIPIDILFVFINFNRRWSGFNYINLW